MPVDPEEADRAALAARLRELEAKLADVESETDRLYGIALRFAKLTVPVLIYLLVLLWVYLFHHDKFGPALGRLASSLLLGKLSAIGGQEDFLFWTFVLGSLDVVVGLFLIWNFDLLYRVPRVGPRLRAFELQGRAFLRGHGWVRRLAFIAVVIVVIVPFQGTGAVMASILGRLIGMGPWRALAAIAIGAYTGIALVLYGSAAYVELARLSPWYGVLFLALIVAGLAVALVRYFRRAGPPAAR